MAVVTSRVRLDTARQKARLALGLIVFLLIAAGFGYAGAVTADSTGKRIAAWLICGLVVVVGVAVAWGGVLAVLPQALVVTPDALAREARRRSWRIERRELRAVAVERSFTYVGVRRMFVRPRTWRVVLRLAPLEPDAFAKLHPELAVYRGRFGAWGEAEWGVYLGPARELVTPLDEALDAWGSGIHRGVRDLGQQPKFSLLVKTVDVHPDGGPLD